MEWLNYHHLLYFWTTVREGGVSAAAQALLVSQPTVSAQLKALQTALRTRLMDRQGRRLRLTTAGRQVYEYADRIFLLGQELAQGLKRGFAQPMPQLVVGVADVVPKLVVHALLQPVLAQDPPVRLVCHEHGLDRMLGDLVAQRMQVVLSDVPLGAGTRVQAFSHLLGQCPLSVMADTPVARRLGPAFPRSLDGQPMYLPAENTAVRRSLDDFLSAEGIYPRVVGEFDDSEMLPIFARGRAAAVPVPSVIEREVRHRYGLTRIGRLSRVQARYYAITLERTMVNPTVRAIFQNARLDLFAATRRSGRSGRGP